MSGLILRLKPSEEVMINGVVVQNGDRKINLRIVTPDANILRMRETIRAHEATTLVKRVFYAAQLGVSGELGAEEARLILEGALADLSVRFSGREEVAALQGAAAELRDNRLYAAMRRLATILDSDMDDGLLQKSLLDEWARWRGIANERRRRGAITVKDVQLHSMAEAVGEATGVDDKRRVIGQRSKQGDGMCCVE